jgi:histidinol-phosphate phosphatase family protein
MNARAVFLDKDGTLIEDVPYNVDPDHVRLLPGAAEGLRSLHAAGFTLIAISNQSGLARGYFPEEALAAVEQRLRALLREVGAPLAGFYYCPHHPDGVVAPYSVACSCRKPEPGLIVRAAHDHRVDRSRSWFLGDILDDVQAGRAAGSKTILIDNGHETEWDLTPHRVPHYIAGDLIQAADIITAAGVPHACLPVDLGPARARGCV